LVAGSSVIITDPIFQGMAISLLAGTLVSTVLTLIVIPLGCVAASRDMCEVAAASAASLPVSGLPCQIEEERRAVDKPRREGGGLSVALAKVFEILTLVFYALRGLMLLLIDLVKGAMKPKPPPRPKPGGPKGGTTSPSTPPPSTGSAPAPSTPAPAGGGGGSQPAPVQASGSEVAPTVAVEARKTQAPISSPGSDDSLPPQMGSSEVAPVVSEKPSQIASTGASELDVASRTANPAAKRGPVKPAAKVSKTSPKSRSHARKDGNGKGAEGPKSGTSAKPSSRATKPLVQSVQKKAPRRGIRLKVDDGAGGEER
jgi:hypothetical protein